MRDPFNVNHGSALWLHPGGLNQWLHNGYTQKKEPSFILSAGQTTVGFHSVNETQIIMKHFNRKLLFSALVLGVMSTLSPLMAQKYKVDIDKPDFDDLQSPEVGGNTGKKNFKPKDWLEAEVKFKITASDPKIKFVNRVTVKWYVAAKNPAPGGKGFVLLEKEINHINVPVGEDLYSSVYLSPTAVKRISGGDRAGKSILSHVGGEVLIDGSKPEKNSGYFTSKGKLGWWTSGKLARYDKIPLRNKNETPFKFLWWDRYAEIEERR